MVTDMSERTVAEFLRLAQEAHRTARSEETGRQWRGPGRGSPNSKPRPPGLLHGAGQPQGEFGDKPCESWPRPWPTRRGSSPEAG